MRRFVIMAGTLGPPAPAVVGPRADPRIVPWSDARATAAGHTGTVPRPPLADLVLALALFAVAVAEVLGAPLAEDVVRGGTALNLVAVAGATLPLAYRRRAPFVVAALVLGAWAGRAVAGPPLEIYPLAIASIVAVYSVAAYGSLRDALLGFGLLALTVGVAAEAGTGGDAAPDVLPSLVLARG